MEMRHGFKQQLLISSGIIFGSLVLATAGIYFLSNDLTAQADRIIADKTLIARQTAVLGILARLKSDAPVAAQYAAAMHKLLPIHDELIKFQQWLTAAAKEKNVSAAFSFRGDNTPATSAILGADGFTMSLEGSATDLAAFLHYLEATAPGYLLAIDGFDFGFLNPGYRLILQGRLFSRAQ